MTSSVALTSEQAKALQTRDTSIALAAGAGCGKTFVLSERFLSHLDRNQSIDPAELHQLIAITFTDAAAREMRRRIRDKCYVRAQQAETTDSQDYWLRLLRAIEAARVSTIHAFCASLLREHAVVAGLDPTFGVLEQAAADVLESEVIDDVLRRQLTDLRPETLDLAAALGLSQLKEQIRELLAKRNTPAFTDWRGKTADELVVRWQAIHDATALPNALAEIAQSPEIRTITSLLSNVAPPTSKPKFVAAKSTLLELLPRLAHGELTEIELEDLRKVAGVQSICNAKDWPDQATFDTYKNSCSRFRDALKKHTPKPFQPDRAREAAELGLRLLDLVHDVADEYQRRKLREGKLDFDDLLSRAHALVTSSENDALRKRISDDLQLVLVDEFQDTDRLQVELVRALCGDVADGKLFFVGDIFQSIYRFRGAQPSEFRNLRDEVPMAGRLPLSKNFRSQPAVLHFVNALFAETFGGDYQQLTANRPQTTAEPAIEFLWTITPDKKAPGGKRDARELEARRIARRLRQLIDTQEPIIADADADGGKRAARPGDVAILFRALSDVAIYENALREYDLDYYLVGGHAYYSQQEIYDVLNLLRAVASGADEISLAGVLRSPFFSLADESLFWLVESAGSLNDGLFSESLPKELESEERQKVLAAAKTLNYLRSVKDSLPIAALLQQALARTAYDAALLAEFLGERKLANLNKLLEQARAADSGNVLDLAGFIAQLAEFVVREPKEALAATLSESADVIRLMTIHHAKGLEFPLVIVPDIDRKADVRTPSAALDDDLGPVVKPPDNDDDSATTTGITLYRALERRAEADERKRLFYVATTRAADYLILSSSLAGYDANELESDWTKLLADRFDLQDGSFRGTLLSSFEAPQVRVTNTEPEIDFKTIGRSRGPDLVELVDSARLNASGGGGIVPPHIGRIAPDATARRQFSVSRLSGKLIRPDSRELELSSLADPQQFDPLAFGTFVHAALARIDLRSPQPIGQLCEQIAAERVLKNAQRTIEEAAELLERFRGSLRWSEIAAAKTVHRELEFLLAWPPDGNANDGRYVQGFFDCVYQDSQGGWHLVDYKTNTRPIAEHYEMQMLLYALAFERAIGKPPVELVLHFLRPGVERNFEWNEAARQRTIDLVNAAMQELVAEPTRPSP